MEGAGGSGEPSRGAREQRQGAAIARQLARELRQSTTLFAQQEPHLAASGQNSPSTSRTAPLPVQNSPRTSRAAPLPVQNSPSSPKMARFGTFSTCRESFIPLPPPRSQAGRILYRTRGRDRAGQHNSTPGPTGAEGTGGSGGSGGPEGLAAAPPGVTAITTPAKVAHNFRRSFFETTQKRCYSNEVISMFEQVARELRATLMGERPVEPHAASHRWACPVSARSAPGQRPVSGRRTARGATRSITPVGLPGQRPVSGRSAAGERPVGQQAASRRRACPVSGRRVARGASSSVSPAGLPAQRPLSGSRAARPCHGLGYSPGAPHRPSRTRRGWTRGRSTGRRGPSPRRCRGP